MKVSDVMTVDVVSVRVDTSFKEIAAALVEEGISAVPVLDEDGFVIGIVSEADLLARQAYPGEQKRGIHSLVDVLAGRDPRWLHKSQGLTAGDVMTPSVFTVSPDDDLHVVARRMLEHELKRMVVVRTGRLVGMVSRSDLMRLFVESDDALRERIERFLVRCGYDEPDHKVTVGVRDGVVHLAGRVLYESDIRVAGSLVGQIDGVVAVSNRLLYREANPAHISSSAGVG
jgi:CBS domain-containing protein